MSWAGFSPGGLAAMEGETEKSRFGWDYLNRPHLEISSYLNLSERTGLNDTMDTHVPTWISALDHPRGKIE